MCARRILVAIVTISSLACASIDHNSKVPSGTKTLRVNGYEMSYVERGKGQTILLIHGIFTDFRYFADAMTAFPESYRVIAVSLRHHYPEQWKGDGNDYSMRQHVSDVAEFIKKLHIGSINVVGHSRGGTLALYLAKDHPNLVRTLIIAEAGVPSFQSSDALAASRERLKSARALMEQGKIDEAFAFLELGGPGSWNVSPENIRQILRDNAWTITGLIKDSSDNWDSFTCHDAKRLTVPVLLMAGEKSPPRRGQILDAIQSCINRPERTIIPNASHAFPRQNPVAFTNAILNFLSKYAEQ